MKKVSFLGILILIGVGLQAPRAQDRELFLYTIRENPDLEPTRLRPGQVIRVPAQLQAQEESDWIKAMRRAREMLKRVEQSPDAESAREALNELEKSIMAARLLTWRKPEEVVGVPRVGTFFQVLSAPF